MAIREVWEHNLDEQLHALGNCLFNYRIISLDTEFPGFLVITRKDASDIERYQHMQFNVNITKLIQLGITLSNEEGKVCSTWEFNFSDFDIEKDPFNRESIDMLKNNGINFEKIHKEGISVCEFAPRLLHILSRHRNLIWVTFHGMCDLGYLMNILTNKFLPPNMNDFARGVFLVLGSVIDIKAVARHCPGLNGGEIGLAKLANILGVERTGGAHNAGSDGLLTASVYAEMKRVYQFDERSFMGCLYGVSIRIDRNLFRTGMTYHGQQLPPMLVYHQGPFHLHRRYYYHHHPNHPFYCGSMQPIVPIPYMLSHV